MKGRVRHATTGAPGQASFEDALSSEFAGDLAGTWSYVDFDDGLSCWVPDANLTLEPQDGDVLYRQRASR